MSAKKMISNYCLDEPEAIEVAMGSESAGV